MKIKVTIEGSPYNWLERNFSGDYDKLHSSDWGYIIRDMLDSIQQFEPQEDVTVEVIDESTN